MSPLFILRLAAVTILAVFGQRSSTQRVGCDPAGCRSDLFNQTETLYMLAGRDHGSFNLETGKVARAFVMPHIDPEPVPEPVAPEPVDPLNPESPNVVTVDNNPIDPATWAIKASTVPSEPSATSLASPAASDALQINSSPGPSIDHYRTAWSIIHLRHCCGNLNICSGVIEHNHPTPRHLHRCR